MARTTGALTAVIVAGLCVTIACGANLKDGTEGNDVGTPAPTVTSTEKAAIDHLVDSIKGYRIVGINKQPCQQLGGMYIMFNCIILTPAKGWKTMQLGNKIIGG
ncbi:uncharacterized protein LOC117343938 [Pecten maximus]|uniref:uncharacterized protein LOC117343938 n=1 Tax=Pecten maximus TaxID=6579 RepID=UPI001458F7BC|nr:uncharacterized protein LOC117343938 [Pecten maximus]